MDLLLVGEEGVGVQEGGVEESVKWLRLIFAEECVFEQACPYCHNPIKGEAVRDPSQHIHSGR